MNLNKILFSIIFVVTVCYLCFGNKSFVFYACCLTHKVWYDRTISRGVAVRRRKTVPVSPTTFMPNTLQLAFAGSFVGTITLLVAFARFLSLPPFASNPEHTIHEPKNQFSRSLVAVADAMGIDATQLMAVGVGALCTCTALYFLSSKRT